jgi:FixJ family two-component response regulator
MRPVVHLVQEDAPCRGATGRMLRAAGYDVIEYASGQELVAANPQGAGCIVADFRMLPVDDLEVQDWLQTAGSILVFTHDDTDIPASVRAMKAGAEDFLIKPVEKERLLDAVARALVRSRVAIINRAEQDRARSLASTLSSREHEVFSLVASGKQNKQIATELGTTVRTIKAHRQKVRKKLQARSLVDLLTIAKHSGLGSSSPRHGAIAPSSTVGSRPIVPGDNRPASVRHYLRTGMSVGGRQSA